MTQKKIYLLALVAVIALILLIGCENQEGKTAVSSGTTNGDTIQPDQVTSNAHIYLYNGGRKTTDLTADEIRQFTDKDSTLAYNLHVDFFDSVGARMSTLTAQDGYIRERDNFLAVSGSVVVIGEDSVKLLTEYLEWDATKDSIVTDSFVTIIRQGDTLTSHGMQSDPTLKNISFKRVSGSLTDIKKVNDDSR